MNRIALDQEQLANLITETVNQALSKKRGPRKTRDYQADILALLQGGPLDNLTLKARLRAGEGPLYLALSALLKGGRITKTASGRKNIYQLA